MMKHKLLAVAIAASLGIAGCSQPEQAKEQTQETAVEAKGEAELGSFGVDLSAATKQ